MTHGQLATELVNSAEMIVGDLPQFTAVSIGWHDEVNDAREDIAEAIERVRGLNGKPITVDGLPSNAFIGYTQYRSTTHTHKSADAQFSYSGTNGFTSRMEADGQ